MARPNEAEERKYQEQLRVMPEELVYEQIETQGDSRRAFAKAEIARRQEERAKHRHRVQLFWIVVAAVASLATFFLWFWRP